MSPQNIFEARVPQTPKKLNEIIQAAGLKQPQDFFGSFLRLKRNWSLVLYQKKNRSFDYKSMN